MRPRSRSTSRLAPNLYRGVVAITRANDGRLAIGGDGEPVEWAVDMVRFDENRTLDHLANEIDDDLADALGRAVAAAHDKAPIVDAEPWIKAVGSYIDEHVVAFAEHREIFPAADIKALTEKSRAHYHRIVPLLRQRGRRGLIRRIHGDLHLGNIALIDGEPVLFDAIEFSAIIGSGDVLYDLAFLLMDLLERQLPQAANIVLNRYLAETHRDEDLDALTTLPFFLSMRAAIRAKVTAARMERAAAAERDNIARSARAYFGFALHAIDPEAAKFIAVGGLSGTGKTRLARALAPHIAPMPGAVIVRSDVERKTLFGAGETEKLPAAAYAPDITARVYAAIADKARRIVAAGHSAIVDAVFATPQERDALAARRRPPKFPCKVCSSPPIWRPESPASAAARTMPRTPVPPLPRRRRTTTSARSNGRKSTLPAPLWTPWPAPGLRFPHNRNQGNCSIDETPPVPT